MANEWMGAVHEAGGKVLASLDWHPPDHCSFCRYGANQERRIDCAWGCEGTQGVCITGAGVPTEVFNSSNRCVDPISDADFQQSRYFQWPPHCVHRTFGADFDPYLRVPPGTEVIKSGFEQQHDSYSVGTGRPNSFFESSPPHPKPSFIESRLSTRATKKELGCQLPSTRRTAPCTTRRRGARAR